MSSTWSEVVGILESSKEHNRVRQELQELLFEINKLHKILQSTPEVVEKPGDNSIARLKILYTQAIELTQSEITISSQLVEQLDTIMPSGLPEKKQRKIAKLETFIWPEHKRKRTKPAADSSKLSQSMRNHLDALASMKGEYVAAKITQENDEKDQWSVVKVLHFDRETRQFEVLDEEPNEDEAGGEQRKEKYKLAMSHIIPFPKLNDTTGAQDFLPGKQVLAVYPGTTTLYKATVVQPRKRKIDDYLLEFDDEDDRSLPQKVVPFHRVVDLPEGLRQ